MEIIQFFVPADGIHIGIESLAWLEAVLFESHAFPLGKRLNDLDIFAGEGLHVKVYRAFHAVKIIIESGGLCHKQRGRDPFQMHLAAEFLLECVADIFDGLLRLADCQMRVIVLGYDQSHVFFLPKRFLL